MAKQTFAEEVRSKYFIINSIFKDINVWDASGIFSCEGVDHIRSRHTWFLEGVADYVIFDAAYLEEAIGRIKREDGTLEISDVSELNRYKDSLDHFVEGVIWSTGGDAFTAEKRKGNKALYILAKELEPYRADIMRRELQRRVDEFLATESQEAIEKVFNIITSGGLKEGEGA